MPGEQHVFLALFAGVTDQRKSQSVIASPAKLVHAGTLAAFRSFTARFLDCNGIASDSVDCPKCGAFGSSDDIERAVGFHRPDSAERVGPCTGQRGWTGARSSSACTH